MSAAGQIVTDYAKSGRSTCRACKIKIDKGALRLGLEEELADYTTTMWYCAECFPGGKIMRTAVLTKVTGIRDITKKDQNALKKIFSKLKLEEESKAQGKKKTTSKKPAPPKAATKKATKSAAPAKKPAKAPAGSSFKGYTSAQYKEYKDIKEELFEEKIDQLKNMLLANKMPRTGTKADLVEKIADGKVLGAIPKCPFCGGGQPRFNNKTGEYYCPGYMEDDEFQRCGKTFDFDEIERVPWQD